jgi:hypothetical protein
VRTQGADGQWTIQNYPGTTPTIDTCFSLLFLRRANLAKDVTLKIQNKLDLIEEKSGKP